MAKAIGKKKKKKRKPKLAGSSARLKVGCYGSTTDHVLKDMAASHSEIPASVIEAFEEKPDVIGGYLLTWDYCIYKDWVVMRLFDDGEETERIVARIHDRRIV